MAFLLSFLGCLFAIVVGATLIYTYVTLRVIPKMGKAIKEALTEGTITGASAAAAAAMLAQLDADKIGGHTNGQRAIVFTCEAHGRCPGCPLVLRQFEAIIREQGEDTMDALERELYCDLRAQYSDAKAS